MWRALGTSPKTKRLFSSLNNSSNATRRRVATTSLSRWPLHVRCIVPAALTRWRSACRLSRSACASFIVLVVLETTDGLHAVLANGLPALPLKLTFLGRRELPVNVENMAAAYSRFPKCTATTYESIIKAMVMAVYRAGCGVNVADQGRFLDTSSEAANAFEGDDVLLSSVYACLGPVVGQKVNRASQPWAPMERPSTGQYLQGAPVSSSSPTNKLNSAAELRADKRWTNEVTLLLVPL